MMETVLTEVVRMMGEAMEESDPNDNGDFISTYIEPRYQKSFHHELGYSIACFCCPPQQPSA